MTETTSAAPVGPQNYILYRSSAYMYQPGYAYIVGSTPVVPNAYAVSPAGTVVATQQLSAPATPPAGFAYALDAEGKYPVGSIYTPPE